MIEVESKNGNEFSVVVEEEGSITKHTVTVDEDYYERLTDEEISKKELIRRSFEFLLERESKESILSRFNLKTINRYFPEYEEIISVR